MGVVDLVRTERAFRRLWLSQVVSELGDWFQFVAVASIFPTQGGGASIIAALIVARHVVAALTSPVAGIVADRYNRGRVMIASDLARALVALGFLLVRGPEDLVLIFVLSLLLEGLSMFFEPANRQLRAWPSSRRSPSISRHLLLPVTWKQPASVPTP